MSDMSVSIVQKIAFLSCLVLCVSMFLPKVLLPTAKKEALHSQVGPGHVPPKRYSHPFSEDTDQWQAKSLYANPFNPETISRTGDARKPNLLSQVIPVYGFGIFLYIIYIFFKLTYKDRSPKQESRFPILTHESAEQEIPDYEMAQLQARLRQMERVTERRAAKATHPPSRSRRGSHQREERKLRQLKHITRVILEGRQLDGVSPEVEAEETPYSSDWEGYAEETFPKYEVAFRGRRYPSIILEEQDIDAPTAEELAERMERAEEENDDDSDEDDHDVEEIKNRADESKVGDAENSFTELQADGEAKQSQYEDEEESEEENDEDKDESHDGEILIEDEDYEKGKEYEEDEEEEEVGEDHPCLSYNTDDEEQGQRLKGWKKREYSPSNRRQITFSDHRRVFHYSKGDTLGSRYEDVVKEDGNEKYSDEDDDDNEEDEHRQEDDQKDVVVKEEEDPLMEAESLGFHSGVEVDPDDQEVNLLDFLLTYQPEATVSSGQPVPPKAPTSGTLRMRHKTVKKTPVLK